MFDRFLGSFHRQQASRPWQVWLGARFAGVVVAAFVVWAMLAIEPIQPLAEPPTIQAVTMSTLEQPRPAIVRVPPPSDVQDPQKPVAPAPVTSSPTPAALPTAPSLTAPSPTARSSTTTIIQDRPTPARAPTVNAGPKTGPTGPLPASNVPTSPTNGQAGAATAQTGSLGSATMRVLRARECARLDVADRPPDCPPNDELRRLLAAERDPKYRPENVEGFSRNELAWRGVPPPCLADGQNVAINGAGACVRFGNVPSRVRTVREICEARGLGGCADAPSQAAVNAAVNQVRKTGQ